MEKASEKKVWGILAIVFGGIALLGSWIPILNNGSFILAIVGLILGVIGLIANRKNTKVLALIGTLLSLAAAVIVLYTQSVYTKSINDAQKSYEKSSRSIESSYSKSSSIEASKESAKASAADANFKWTDAYFDSIVDGTTTYDEIVAKVGEPNKTSTGTEYDFDSDGDVANKDCDWDLEDGSYTASLSIHFVEKNGSFVVDYKVGSGLK